MSFTSPVLTTASLMPSHITYSAWSIHFTRPKNPPLPTPTRCNGACRVMLMTSEKSRQPILVAWSCDWLYQEHAITLGYALDLSTLHTYNSHLQSFLSYFKLHSLPLDPLWIPSVSFIVFMSHHIKPLSVMKYLSKATF